MDRQFQFHLHTEDGEDLSGKTYCVDPNDPAKRKGPYVWVQKKDAGDAIPHTTGAWTSGYAMKLEFGLVKEQKVTGRIYLCLPAAAKTVVAGTFVVELPGKAGGPLIKTFQPRPEGKKPLLVGNVPAWIMDPAMMVVPDEDCFGKLFGADFKLEKASLSRLALSLHAGKASITIFHGLKGVDVAGKSILIKPSERASIHMRQPNPAGGLPKTAASDVGNALKLEFGPEVNGMIVGRIYLCLAKDRQTIIAGNFTIERK